MAPVTRAVALVSLLLVASVARAQDRSLELDARALLDEARRQYAELDFVACVETLNRALATPGLPDGFRAEALETLGAAYVVLDRQAPAREAFESLFRIDPYYTVREPSGSPRIARFVETVRARVVPDAALDPDTSVSLDLPRSARVGRPVHASVRTSGPIEVTRVTVLVRGEEEVEWTELEAARAAGVFTVEIPARTSTEELTLYAIARDAEGRVIARAAGPLTPLTLPVRERDEGGGSILEEWWLWALVGAAVVGAGVSIGVAASGPGQAPPGTLPPGRVELP